jgi:4-amino-4-deoxy-L-arabinose transferase-like glycosyltransferase
MKTWPRRTTSFLLAVLALTFLLHLLVIAEPFGRDQGIFAYIGQALLRGDVPYRDAWDHKTPGIYAAYALAFTLFGQAMPSVHLLEAIALTVAALFVFLIGRRLRGDAGGLWGALLYGSGATLLFEWWDRGQAEIYMGLTGALAVYAIVRASEFRTLQEFGTQKTLWLLLCGVFCGLTVYFKPTGATLLAALALAVVLLRWSTGVRSVLKALLALAAGAALSFLPLFVYFAAHGALDDLYQTIIVFNAYHTRIGGNPTLAGSITGTLDFLVSMNLLAPLAVVGAWLAVRAVADERRLAAGLPAAGVVLVLWLLGTAAGIWTQGKFFSYHWSPVLPPLALLAGWGVAGLLDELRQNRSALGQRLGAVVCIAVLAVYGVALARDHAPKWTRDARYLLGQTSSQQYLANFAHNIQGRDIYSFPQTLDTARYVQARTDPDDTVLVWGFQSLVNFLADRRAPTRYIFTYPLTFDRPETAFRVQARRTFLNDLKLNPPVYIVLVTNDINPLQAVDSLGLIGGFPEFQQIMRRDYHLETDIGEFHIYRRNDA